MREGYREPCNLWVACALPPGSRKSSVQSAATAPLVAWEREGADAMREDISRARSARATAEARAKALRTKAASKGDGAAAKQAADIEAELPEVPVAPVVWTSDATPERLGVLLAEHGESIAWLSAEGGIYDTLAGRYSAGVPNLDLVLGAWSGDPHRVDRVGRASIHLRHPRLTLALAPQPAVIEGLAAQPGFRGRGLLGRMLYMLPPSGIGYRDLETEPWAAKLAGNVVRITGVLHVIVHSDGRPEAEPVARATMDCATTIGAVLIEHACAAYEMMDADPAVQRAAIVWQWLEARRAAVSTVREVQRGCRELRDVATVEAALAELETRGYVRLSRPEPRGPGRPPSPTVTVRPDIVASWR